MRGYISRWRQPTRRDLAAAILVCGVVFLSMIWAIHASQTHSQEQKRKTFESCLNAAASQDVSGLPSFDEIQACKQEAGVK